MSVETWETSGAIGGIDQTKNRIINDPLIDELEEWYAENGDQTLDIVDRDTEAKAGSANVEMLPLHYAIELKQIRQSYDQEELQALADRMPVEFVDGEPRIDLIHPPTLNVLDRENAIVYLEKLHKYHRGEIEPIDIDTLPSFDGKYYILINGHRRTRALKLKCLELGIRPEKMKTSFRIEENLPFIKAKPKQYVENTSSQIKPVEDARAIELHHLFLRDEGEDYSVAALRKVFGYSEDKIRSALRFVTAPEEIAKFVGNGLTYGNVVDLVRLREEYAKSIKHKITYDYQEERTLLAGEPEEVQERLLQDYWDALKGVSDKSEERMKDYFEKSILKRLKGKTTADVGGSILAQIRLIGGDYGYTNESLLVYDEEAERRMNRGKTRRQLGGVAIEMLAYLIAQDDLSPEQIAELQQLIDSKRKITRPVAIEEEVADVIPLFEEEIA